MSDRLTAAGEALVAEVHGTTMSLVVFPARIRAIETEAAARAVDEALSVERVHDILASDPRGCEHPRHMRPQCERIAAALVTHLRGPR